MNHTKDIYILVKKSDNSIVSVYDDIELVISQAKNKDYLVKGPYLLNNKQHIDAKNNNNTRTIFIDPKNTKYLPDICPDTPRNIKVNKMT